MEYIDVFTRDGIPTGKIKEKHEEKLSGEYYRHVSVFMLRIEVPEGGFSFDTYEVNDVKIMPFHEFYDHVMDHNDEEMGRGLKEIEQIL